MAKYLRNSVSPGNLHHATAAVSCAVEMWKSYFNGAALLPKVSRQGLKPGCQLTRKQLKWLERAADG